MGFLYDNKMYNLLLRYEEAAEQASSSRSISSEEESTSNDPESQNSKQTRKPTKASSRGAIIATVVYCKLYKILNYPFKM